MNPVDLYFDAAVLRKNGAAIDKASILWISSSASWPPVPTRPFLASQVIVNVNNALKCVNSNNCRLFNNFLSLFYN